jgi:hypothetical protein
MMGEKDPTGELGKVAEILPDIADPDAGLSEEERQAMVGTAPASIRIPPC